MIGVLAVRLVRPPGPHRAVSGHGLVTDAVDWALRNVTRRDYTDIFPQVRGLGSIGHHHAAWPSCNIKWKPGNEPDDF